MSAEQTTLALHALYSPTLRRIPAVVLIACSSQKGREPAPARELYRGALFKAAARYAQAAGLPWAVLSARYGLVLPSDIIAPYDETLAEMRPTRRVAWAMNCVISLFRRVGHPARAVLLAGTAYREPIEAQLRQRGVPEIAAPLAGLAIGQQKRRLAELLAEFADGVR